jgi:addiction module RelE/StbE family toxin
VSIRFHHTFDKQFAKLRPSVRARVKERLALFFNDPYHPQLRNHPLRGKYLDYRSVDITGDIRAIYKHVSEDEAIFVAIGTHGQLYR